MSETGYLLDPKTGEVCEGTPAGVSSLPAETIVALLNEGLRDAERLDKLQAWASERGCGWTIDRRRGALSRKHFSQEAPYHTVRDAIDALPEVER